MIICIAWTIMCSFYFQVDEHALHSFALSAAICVKLHILTALNSPISLLIAEQYQPQFRNRNLT